MSLHDDHYKEANEALGIETVDLMEALLRVEIPEEYHEILDRNFRNAMMQKYQLRLGRKDGDSKEIDKIVNWAHRLQTGEFLKEGE